MSIWRLSVEAKDQIRARTGCVCNLHTQDEDKGGIVWSCQVVADQTADLSILGHEAQPECPCDVGDQEDQNEDTASVLEAVVEVDTGEDGESD